MSESNSVYNIRGNIIIAKNIVGVETGELNNDEAEIIIHMKDVSLNLGLFTENTISEAFYELEMDGDTYDCFFAVLAMVG